MREMLAPILGKPMNEVELKIQMAKVFKSRQLQLEDGLSTVNETVTTAP